MTECKPLGPATLGTYHKVRTNSGIKAMIWTAEGWADADWPQFNTPGVMPVDPHPVVSTERAGDAGWQYVDAIRSLDDRPPY